MSDPILISDGEDDSPPSKRPRNNYLSDDDVTVVKSFPASSSSSSRRRNKFSGKPVISLESDSEDAPSNSDSDSLEAAFDLHSTTPNSHGMLPPEPKLTTLKISTSFGKAFLSDHNTHRIPSSAIQLDSDHEKEDTSVEKLGQQKQTTSSKTTSLSAKALPKKHMSKDQRIRATEENKLRKQQEKSQKAAAKAEEAEQRKIEKEMQKWEKGKVALKSIVAEIDLKLLEESVGAPLISMFREKGITYRATSNPIKGSIVWKMTLPEDIAQTLPLGPVIRYVLLVYEAEEFCSLVADERLLDNISRIRDLYPSYKVCYLTNKLMSYVKKREREEFNDPVNHNGWRKPPIDEVLAKLTTHYIGVHSRHCVDDAEVAEHVVRLTSNLAYCLFRKKLTRLSVNADGASVLKGSVDRHLIKDSPWLRALVAIPKVQPRHAVAVGKKYPCMKSLLKVYMDPNISVHEKEFLLKDLKVEGIVGGDTRLGEVCSKRIYRVLMSPSGTINTDEVENGAALFTFPSSDVN